MTVPRAEYDPTFCIMEPPDISPVPKGGVPTIHQMWTVYIRDTGEIVAAFTHPIAAHEFTQRRNIIEALGEQEQEAV